MRNKGFAPIVLLIVIVLVAGAYYIGKNNFSLPLLSSLPSSLPQLTSTPGPSDNWKTYTNSKYGFSFKYPSSVTPKAEEGVQSIDLRISMTLSPTEGSNPIAPTLSIMVFSPLTNKSTVDSQASATLDTLKKYPGNPGEIATTSFQNLPAKTIYTKSCTHVSGVCEARNDVFFAKNNYIYGTITTVGIMKSTGNADPRDSEQIQQILATLKFTQ